MNGGCAENGIPDDYVSRREDDETAAPNYPGSERHMQLVQQSQLYDLQPIYSQFEPEFNIKEHQGFHIEIL